MIPVAAAVILRSGMVLLARRKPGDKHAGLWEFPGGRIEPGETSAAALARELKEELGIDAEVGDEAARSRHRYPFGEVELIAHFVKKFTGTITLTDHDKVMWVEARKLLEHPLVAADIPIAEKIASHRRRDRYDGTHPKAFAQKYKELSGDPEAVAKAKARGSTPAGAHVSIMVPECLEALAPLEGATVVDCTLGWGGHTEALLANGASVVGLDRDGEELARTVERLTSKGAKLVARQSDYADAAAVLAALKLGPVDAVFADLGVSSMQLDRPERGMSFKVDGPLDMRMDRSRGPTAYEWLEAASEAEIEDALTRYGDEPDAKAIARHLVKLAAREGMPKTTHELAAAIGVAKGLGPERATKRSAFSAHPATRVFQALRIAVNGERESLKRLLAGLPGILKPGGRAVFLTFHSGEEALVQAALKGVEGPKKASAEEVRENPRSRSARLWRWVRP